MQATLREMSQGLSAPAECRVKRYQSLSVSGALCEGTGSRILHLETIKEKELRLTHSFQFFPSLIHLVNS